MSYLDGIFHRVFDPSGVELPNHGKLRFLDANVFFDESSRETRVSLKGIGPLVPNDPVAATANTQTIKDAVVAASGAGGSLVVIPPGLYYLQSLGDNTAIGMAGLSNVRILGAGIGATTLRLRDNGSAHMISITDCQNIEISNLTLDGNRAGQSVPLTHCIRGNGVDGLWLHHLHIRNAPVYGIGLQSTFKRFCYLTDLKVEGSGADNIDIKNNGDNNAQCVVSNVQLGEFDVLGEGGKSGLDLRGPWQVSNVTLRFTLATDSSAGVRFRNGELLEANGFGAHLSNAVNIEVYAPANMIGIAVAARNVQLSNVHTVGGGTGIYLTGGENCRIANANVEGAANGILIDSNSPGVELHGVRIDGCTTANLLIEGVDCRVIGGTYTNGPGGITVNAARARISGARAIGNTGDGIFVQNGADHVSVTDCIIKDNGDEGISIRGSYARIEGNYFSNNTSGAAIECEANAANTYIDGNFLDTGEAINDLNGSAWIGPANYGGGFSRIVVVSGTSATLGSAHTNKTIRCTSGSAVTITVPTNGTTPFPIGAVIEIVQAAAGAVSLSPAGGVVLNGTTSTAAQWQTLRLRKVSTDTWDVSL